MNLSIILRKIRLIILNLTNIKIL